jgi:C-methyltransferase
MLAIQLTMGSFLSAAIGVAARLGVADVLAEPLTNAELTAAVGVEPDAIEPSCPR